MKTLLLKRGIGGLVLMPEKEYIEREAVMKIIDDYGTTHGSILGSHSGAVDAVGDIIYHLPVAAVASVVHAHWEVRRDNPQRRRRCYCSSCKRHNGIGGIAKNQERSYCPNCGAKMDEDN